MWLKSLLLVQNLRVIFQAWPEAISKALTRQVPREKLLFLQQTWFTASALWFLKGDAGRAPGPLARHAPSQICTSSPGPSFLSFSIWCLGHRVSWGFCWIFLMGPGRGESKFWRHFPPLWLSSQYCFTPSPPQPCHLLSIPQAPASIPESMNLSKTLTGVPFSEGNERGGSLHFPQL